MEIKSISQKIFGTAPATIEGSANHTNPFGVNFKGNMIMADVFSSATEKSQSFTGKVNKLVDAVRVGSMNAFSDISTRFNSAVSRIKTRAVDFWNNARNTEINFGTENLVNNLRERVADLGANSVSRLSTLPVSDLETRLTSAIEARG